MSAFDGLQKSVFTTINTSFGDVATWTPSNATISQTEKILFKSSDEPMSIGQPEKYAYRPTDYSIEYFSGQFNGLKELVDGGNLEIIMVNGLTLNIREVWKKFDGKTFVAYAEL